MSNLIAKNDNKSGINIPPNRRNARSHLGKTKITQEEGKDVLEAAFDLADEGGDLKFSLLACAFKIECISC